MVVDIKRIRNDVHHKTTPWVEIALDIAVTHPQGLDIWVGMWTPMLSQLLETRFEISYSTYANALTNLSEKALIFYRKAINKLSKALGEAVAVLWNKRTETIKKLAEQINNEE